ncbi:two-component sensor histidine kinase [Pilimelia anulata]|uniref:histidine kinase n=1 Tax=Pilimelia anulata TaxID=53371 RepID=A0A8J3B4U5_9ACTN|nr:HAMP domain-containing sensor histidine kinase [Pilimelia anulata]GGJ81539.1 two-component sensor histidine kinase [Pilimelia anulata]
MSRLSLRTRIVAMFGVGALASCATMAALSYELTRRTQLAARERVAVRAAQVDARVVVARLSTEDPDLVEVLRWLDTGGSRRVLLRRDGRWYSRSADTGLTSAVPRPLQRRVADGTASVQRVRLTAAPGLVVGVPLPNGDQLYVVESLRELDRTLRGLSWIIALVAAGTTVAGAGVGAYAARRVTRPLARVTAAAREIAAGEPTARLDPATEPDVEELATAFNDMVGQLARRMELDRRFAADVSHELRSPLQTLVAAVDVLNRRRDALDERSRRALDLVVAESDRFRRLVTDLLDLSRGDTAPRCAPTDVVALARHACGHAAVDPGLVAADTGGDDRWEVDPRRFERVLVNLLENAVRHGGGPVAITVRSAADARTIEIDDAGPGVRPGDRGRVFDRFVRGRAASARGDTDGTGLGLALVAAHVAAHGGRADVVDRPGGGARFRVILPRRPADAAAPTGAAP